MKFPNHIILDISKPILHNITKYWIFSYLPSPTISFFLYENITTLEKFKRKRLKLINLHFRNEEKFTFTHNFTDKTFLLSDDLKLFYKNLFKNRPKVINKLLVSRYEGKRIFILLQKKKYNLTLIKNMIINTSNKLQFNQLKSFVLWRLFDINFLKKEHLYTKLKYSRTPQYDIVSGGVAALFAGFLGFLICEKFGLELLDSGDFYFLFIYFVFLCFFFKLILKHFNGKNDSWNIFSYKWFFYFYNDLFLLFLNKFIKK